MKITQEIAHNIFYHVEKCWDYVDPTSTALETAVYRGFLPFYDTVEHLGSPSTIVDVRVGDNALDIKGAKKLKIVKELTPKQNQVTHTWKKHTVDGSDYYLGIPNSVMTQARRPKVDLEGYRGDCKEIMLEQLADYKKFAEATVAKAGCNKIYTLVGLYHYHEKLKIKAFSLSLLEFELEDPDTFVTNAKSYVAKKDGVNVFEISSMNKGSSNLLKRYNVKAQYSRMWTDKHNTNMFEKHTVDNLINE